ncbi:MAG: hypothetical protein H0V10_05620 [Geodermatophilaceae bacterium]|nr:hypothetical protein [Geodermatophilaceae bacterium]
MTVTPQVRPGARMPDPDFVHPELIAPDSRSGKTFRYLAAAARLSIGWVFLWAFLDKLLALGFSTGRDGETGIVDRFGDAAWINGGSPTEGFLTFGTKGPFADIYQSFAGAAWANWLFMLGLAGIGIALIAGIGMRIAAVAGATLLVFMWSAALPPENNPFMDYHLVYAIVLGMLGVAGAGRTLGLGSRWEALPIVQKYSFLK